MEIETSHLVAFLAAYRLVFFLLRLHPYLLLDAVFIAALPFLLRLTRLPFSALRVHSAAFLAAKHRAVRDLVRTEKFDRHALPVAVALETLHAFAFLAAGTTGIVVTLVVMYVAKTLLVFVLLGRTKEEPAPEAATATTESQQWCVIEGEHAC